MMKKTHQKHTQPSRLPLAMKSLYTSRAFVPEFYSRLDMCVYQSSMVTYVCYRTDDLRSTVKLSRLYDICSDATITPFMAYRNENKYCNCNFRLSFECLLLLVCCSWTWKEKKKHKTWNHATNININYYVLYSPT